jgi:hypothetical protein
MSERFRTAIQIIAIVIILLVLLEIGLIIFFKIMEYHASVAKSLNVTPNLIGTAVRVLIFSCLEMRM